MPLYSALFSPFRGPMALTSTPALRYLIVRRDSYLALCLWPEWPRCTAQGGQGLAQGRYQLNWGAHSAFNNIPTPHPQPNSGIFSQPKERTPVLTTSQNSAQTPGVMGLCGGQPDLPPVLDAFLGRRRFPPACSNWNIF